MCFLDFRDHAATIWAQRNDRLLVTVSLSDCKDPSIEFKSDSLNIRYVINAFLIEGNLAY